MQCCDWEYIAAGTGGGVDGQVSSIAGWGRWRSLGRALFTNVFAIPAGGPFPHPQARAQGRELLQEVSGCCGLIGYSQLSQ